MPPPLRILCWLMLALLGGSFAVQADDGRRTEVIQLRSETAERLLPLLQPVAPEGVGMTGRGAQLIVRGTDAELQELQGLLEQLDRPPRRLLISLGTRIDSDASSRQDSATIRLGNSSDEVAGAVELRSYGTQDRNDRSILQRVQTIDGQPAFIASGAEVIFPLQALVSTPAGAVVGNVSQTVSATTGFYVLARVNGTEVQLELALRREDLLPGAAGVSGQGLSSSVAGTLGSWIDVGGASTEFESRTGNGRQFGTRALRNESERMAVRVDELP
jgi:hypothetical protein